MKRKLSGMLTLFLALVVQFTFAQEKTISGVVSDDSGLPLPGTTVLVKGTSTGVSTDFDGKYAITVNTGQVLVFSFVGYANQEVTVGASNTINVTMQEDISSLEEVVVVAYGTQTKQSIVGSVGVVSDAVIETQQVTSPLRAIQGVVPGVNLLTQGGQPGNNPVIRIRGFGSLNASQAPLIVVDGAAFNGNLNTISQDQIESISVLKDASSTALYGSRGANGVILITTKKGYKNTAPKLTFRSQLGISNPTIGLHDLVGAEDYLKLNWEALKNTNQYVNNQSPTDAAQNATNGLIDYVGYNPFSVDNPIDTNGNLVPGANLLWETDWEDVLIRDDVLRVNHNVNLSGGDDKSTYFMSLDYLKDNGPVIRSSFERVSARLNLESQVTDWLKTGLRTSFSRSYSGNPDQTSGSVQQVISYIYGVASIYPIYVRDANGALIRDSNGNLIYDIGDGYTVGQPVNSVRNAFGGENVLASITLGQERRKRTSFLGNAFAEVKLFEGLTFKTNFSYENYLFDSFSFNDDQVGFAEGIGGRISQDRDITTTVNAVQSLNYNRDFGNHNLNLDLITEAYTFEYDYLDSQGTGYLAGVEVLDGSTVPEYVGGNTNNERLNSYLARVAYNYNDKYYAEFSGRRDGSSRFGSDVRWGNFFAAGASWVVSAESFLSDSDVITYLKLKGSYGELGNNQVLDAAGNQVYFPYQAGFNLGWNNEGNTGVLLGGVADPFITWEKTASTNVGMDFELFNGALSGSVEYFNKESIDLIYNKPLPSSTGVDEITTNIGSIKNFGWEVSLSSNIVNTEDFTWTAGMNFSLIENEITELTQDEFINGSKLWKEGNSIFDFYIRDWAGVDPADGRGMWFVDVEDAEGNVIDRVTTKNYNEASRYQEGSSIPDVFGGLTTFLRYKQFDLNILANFSFGAQLLDTDYSGLMNQFESPGSPIHPDNFKRWQNPGDITDVPLLLASNNDHAARSNRFLFDNDYVRLKSLTLGYNFPGATLNKFGVSRLRLFLQADNMLTWQSHKGIDPEQSFNGLTSNRSPLSKTITTGVIVEF
ncbi:SusC/RagA family TonB-linked outer membrane protein [Aestuariivivens sediminicola]|uniref:SusC/RagA family TonB-linked outer membrane protein n=1 Tax=Aestuariivivens sediminicola TaxID=2913560 RepID=UPI001F56A0F8|nr:TonB-dependent receptor [Aestuariivivens sediminicola]